MREITINDVCLSTFKMVIIFIQDIVLSSSQDEFYAGNLYSNFGEIGQTIKVSFAYRYTILFYSNIKNYTYGSKDFFSGKKPFKQNFLKSLH